ERDGVHAGGRIGRRRTRQHLLSGQCELWLDKFYNVGRRCRISVLLVKSAFYAICTIIDKGSAGPDVLRGLYAGCPYTGFGQLPAAGELAVGVELYQTRRRTKGY